MLADGSDATGVNTGQGLYRSEKLTTTVKCHRIYMPKHPIADCRFIASGTNSSGA